jgi:hypothetical protein
MTEIVKIFAVSLTGLQKYKAYAVYNGEQLAVTHILPIKGVFGSWKASLIEEIKKKKADGFVCIVEEKTDYVARHASQFNLEEMDGETGRSNFYTALDWYFALQETENLIVAKDFQNFVIRAGGEGQRVEKKQDEKGRVIYSINWSAFTAGYRCLLLCVVGAMVEPVSHRYLDEMLKVWLTPETPENNPLSSFHAITSGYTMTRLQEVEAARRRE